MGFYYRKSANLGPFRLNVSKSGLGFSVGGRGFRSGVSSTGRKYTSMSLPGTGLRYVKYHGKSSTGCLLPVLVFLTVVAMAFWFIR
ncbi:MAG: DUF4236 domain-containing protein [Myxococcales bacterium]|nr:DUF4236 domain-containing protein [Myxococcales bacterium]